MGTSHSKHYDLASSGWPKANETLVLASEVCNIAEELASCQCGKHEPRVYRISEQLRALSTAWQDIQHDSMQLAGEQVFEVANALQVFNIKLAW
jgi:hypothetical protein